MTIPRVLVFLFAMLLPSLALAENAVVKNNRAFALHQKGDYEGALALYDEIVRSSPNYGLAWANRGSTYLSLGRYDKGIADISKAIALGANDPVIVLNRGTAYFLKGDYERALADCSAIIRTHPKNPVARRTCGVAYEKTGQCENAFASFDEAIRLNPRHAKAFLARGIAYQRVGEPAKALADLARAVKLAPEFEKQVDFAEARRSAQAALATPSVPTAVTAAKPVVPTSPVASAAPVTAPLAENRVALVIANGAYATVGRLDNPPRDAAAVAASLREAGFRSVHLASDLSAEGLRRALNHFSAEAAQADWALVYCAGHGIEVGGVNYLVPVDASLKTDRAVQFEGVPLDSVLAGIEGARKLKLVILDACRDNPFLPGMQRTVATRSVGRGLAKVEPESGSTLVAYAARAGQVALDGEPGDANSPFAAAWVRTMNRPGVETRKFFGLVRDDVLARTNGSQEPFVYGSLGGDDYFFRAP